MPSKLSRASGAVSTVAAGLLLAACSAGGQAPIPDMTVLPPDLSLADLKDSTYPAGPFGDPRNGLQPGDVIPDFTFQGYFAPMQTTGLASGSAFREVTLGMIHDSGARFALLEIGAFY